LKWDLAIEFERSSDGRECDGKVPFQGQFCRRCDERVKELGRKTRPVRVRVLLSEICEAHLPSLHWT